MSLIGIYLRTIWQLARPRTLILIWLHIVLGYLLLTGEVPVIDSVVLALLASAMSYISAVAMNDIADEEVDRLNLIHQRQAADRPIVNQTSSSRQVARIAIVTSLMTIIAGVAIAPWLGGAALLMVLLNAAYSLPPLQISKRGGLAQLLLPLMYVLYPFAIALAVSGQNAGWSYWLMAVGLYLLFVGRLFLKDIRDEVGDRRVGKRTYLVRHGLRPTLLQSAVWLIIGIGCSFAAMLQHTTHVFVLSIVAGDLQGVGCVALPGMHHGLPPQE